MERILLFLTRGEGDADGWVRGGGGGGEVGGGLESRLAQKG